MTAARQEPTQRRFVAAVFIRKSCPPRICPAILNQLAKSVCGLSRNVRRLNRAESLRFDSLGWSPRLPPGRKHRGLKGRTRRRPLRACPIPLRRPGAPLAALRLSNDALSALRHLAPSARWSPVGESPFTRSLLQTAWQIVRRAELCSARGKVLTYLATLGYPAAMLSKELVAASTVPLVLSVLAEGESYGYALIQRVRELSGGRIEWTEGMLYPVLHWMEDQGLVESEWKEAETGRKRKYYRLRKEGRKALQAEKQQWLTVHTTLTKLWKTQPSLT